MRVSLPFWPMTGDSISAYYLHTYIDGAFVSDIGLDSFEDVVPAIKTEGESNYTAAAVFKGSACSYAPYPGISVQSVDGTVAVRLRPGLNGIGKVISYQGVIPPGGVVGIVGYEDLRSTNVSGPFLHVIPKWADVGYNYSPNAVTGVSAYMCWDAPPLGVVQATVASGASEYAPVCMAGITGVRVRLRSPFPNNFSTLYSLPDSYGMVRGIGSDASYIYYATGSYVIKTELTYPHSELDKSVYHDDYMCPVSDGEFVYACRTNADKLMRMVAANLSDATEISIGDYPTSVALTDDWIYVAVRDNGRIAKVSRSLFGSAAVAASLARPLWLTYERSRNRLYALSYYDSVGHIREYSIGANGDLVFEREVSSIGKWALTVDSDWQPITTDGQYLYYMRGGQYLMRVDLDTLDYDHSWSLPAITEFSVHYEPVSGHVLLMRATTSNQYMRVPLKNYVAPGDLLIYRGHRASRPDVFSFSLACTTDLWRAIPGTVCGFAMDSVSAATGPAVRLLRCWWFPGGTAWRIPAAGHMR